MDIVCYLHAPSIGANRSAPQWSLLVPTRSHHMFGLGRQFAAPAHAAPLRPAGLSSMGGVKYARTAHLPTVRRCLLQHRSKQGISLSLQIMSLAAGVAIRAARRLDMAGKTTVTLTQLAATLAEEHQLTKRAGRELLGNLVSLITKHLKKGEQIRIAGLGILQVRKRAARMGRNPATGEAIKIKATKKVAFRASKELKEAI